MLVIVVNLPMVMLMVWCDSRDSCDSRSPHVDADDEVRFL